MAMAPISDVEREGGVGRSLSREDCLCPICLEIFMEPVTLPCTHTFCKACFLESVDKATLCCPLCRKRVAVWARQHSRNKSLVNEALWRRIQAAFPRQKQDDDYEPVFLPRLSEPGALRQEYEDQISKLTEEKRELEEQEQKASEELIRRLLAEEEQHLREQQQRQEEDERLARVLSRELNSAPDQSPTPEPPKKKLTGMDRFLFPVSRSPAHSSTSNKENILEALDPPPLDYYGQSQPEESWPEDMDQSLLTDEPVEGGTKRKSPSAEEAESQGKRSCGSSCLLGVAKGEWEAELQRRRKQEEEDLRVALELQKQLDRQQRADRSKGSIDAYELRAPRRGASTGTSAPPTPAPRKKRPASSTATLSSTLNANRVTATAAPSVDHTPPRAGTAPSESEPPPGPPRAPAAVKRDAARPKTSQTSPQTAKSKRQTTLTDLFNLHSVA